MPQPGCSGPADLRALARHSSRCLQGHKPGLYRLAGQTASAWSIAHGAGHLVRAFLRLSLSPSIPPHAHPVSGGVKFIRTHWYKKQITHKNRTMSSNATVNNSFWGCEQVGGGPTGTELAAEMHDLVVEDMVNYFPKLKVVHP